MSEKLTSTKPSGSKRGSKPPEPSGFSSDSSRSRSLSPGRSSSRKVEVEETKKSVEAQSKWSLSQYVSSSDDSDKDNFADSVSKRVKFRRQKGTKALAKEVNTQVLAEEKFKIPK